MSNEKLTSFTNKSKRSWSEEECRIMINAALLKLIDDAGGSISISTDDLFKIANKGSLALSLSDNDKILTVTRVRDDKDYPVVDGIVR